MSNKLSYILVTGAAGFIGAELVIKLLQSGENVIGIDNLNNYYDVSLKKARLERIKNLSLKTRVKWFFYKISIEDEKSLFELSKNFCIKKVVNLAAQAGVRYSIENPKSYINSNLLGFGNILEFCRKFEIENLIFASSSSVYGGNKTYPYREDQGVDHPISLYAATKKANEMMAHSYSHLYKIPATGLRFFTVYGPWGRPDMAPMIFTKSIIEGKILKIFNYGNMSRDFTYIDDVVEGIYRCCEKSASEDISYNSKSPDPSISSAPYRLLNIGNHKPVKLMRFIELLETELKIDALKEFLPMQQGDVENTYSDSSKLRSWINFSPKISIEEGVKKFVGWYRDFYNI